MTTPFKIEISRASEGAIDAVEAIGGEVTTVHYNKLALRALLAPHKFGVVDVVGAPSDDDDDERNDSPASRNSRRKRTMPKFARPPPKWQPYYTNWKKRGYLSVQAQMRKLLSERPELEEAFAKAISNTKNEG